jgi:uncharacterized protein YndB with AHSA1/START domain
MYDPREVPPDQPIILLTREIAAPAELIFKAFGDAATIGTWWGPDGFTTTTERLDFRVGGDWLHMMHGPDGTNYPNYSVYRELVPYERIVYDHATAPGEPFLFRAEIRLTALGARRTRIRLETRFNDVATRDMIALQYGAVEGGQQHLAHLDAYVTGRGSFDHRIAGQDLVLTRRFKAPPAQVFAAWTEAEQMARWWGPHDFEVPECISEPHPGGRFRVVVRAPDGTDYPMDGRYAEVKADQRLVLIASVDEHPPSWHATMAEAIRNAGGPADAVVGRMTLMATFETDSDGTWLTVTLRAATAAEAEALGAVGADQGWRMSFERLDAVLAEGG